jgi:hypothetical protein
LAGFIQKWVGNGFFDVFCLILAKNSVQNGLGTVQNAFCIEQNPLCRVQIAGCRQQDGLGTQPIGSGAVQTTRRSVPCVGCSVQYGGGNVPGALGSELNGFCGEQSARGSVRGMFGSVQRMGCGQQTVRDCVPAAVDSLL